MGQEIVILNMVVRERLTEKVTSEQSPEVFISFSGR